MLITKQIKAGKIKIEQGTYFDLLLLAATQVGGTPVSKKLLASTRKMADGPVYRSPTMIFRTALEHGWMFRVVTQGTPALHYQLTPYGKLMCRGGFGTAPSEEMVQTATNAWAYMLASGRLGVVSTFLLLEMYETGMSTKIKIEYGFRSVAVERLSSASSSNALVDGLIHKGYVGMKGNTLRLTRKATTFARLVYPLFLRDDGVKPENKKI